MTQQEVLG